MAALGLGAVEPDGLGVLNSDGEGLVTLARWNGNEARVDALTTGERLARLVEGRLGNGVVGRVVVELNQCTSVGFDVVGSVDESAFTSSVYTDIYSLSLTLLDDGVVG